MLFMIFRVVGSRSVGFRFHFIDISYLFIFLSLATMLDLEVKEKGKSIVEDMLGGSYIWVSV